MGLEVEIPKSICLGCGTSFKRKGKYCSSKCYHEKGNKIRKVENRPSLDILLQEIKELGFLGTGRKYGVSGTSIRRWINLAKT